MTVYYVTPTSAPVTEFEEFTGRTAATQVVELRARVSGYLESSNFEEGSDVQKDNVLFKIDDRPFVAEERRTDSVVSQFDARVKRLTSQLQRAQELLTRKATSQDEFDTVKYDLDEAKAKSAKEEAERILENRGEAMEIAEAQAKLAEALAQLQALERLRKNMKH